jgi:hypothetical protein
VVEGLLSMCKVLYLVPKKTKTGGNQLGVSGNRREAVCRKHAGSAGEGLLFIL